MDMTDKDEKIRQLTQQCDRIRQHFECVYKWLGMLEEGVDLMPFFEEHQCQKIGIYGASDLGMMLQKEINRDGRIKVAYFMDRNARENRMIGNVPVYLPEEVTDTPEVDMLVVTAIVAYDSIWKKLLEMKPELPIVSLNTIVDVRVNEVWI